MYVLGKREACRPILYVTLAAAKIYARSLPRLCTNRVFCFPVGYSTSRFILGHDLILGIYRATDIRLVDRGLALWTPVVLVSL